MNAISPPDARGNVLLVDDDVMTLRALSLLLRAERFGVNATTTAERAIEHVRAGGVDVVVTDVSMPGMSGIELLRAIRQHEPDLPVILVTGAPDLDTATQALEYGALEYIVKPADATQLERALERAVRLHRFARTKREALVLQGRSGEASDRAGLEAGFERALDSLWMAFQPIVRAADGSIFGYEALMRTDEPALPGAGPMLEAAERLGSLPRLGNVVCARAAAPIRDSSLPGALFVNLHPDELLEPEFCDGHPELCAMADRVVLEVTERAPLPQVERVRELLKELRTRGFRIALDDLGAGHAGLSSFATLEPEIVKLDMALVRDIDQDETRRKVVGAMTALSHDMGMLAVAEGVETAAERDVLVSLGCDLLQGFLFGRPGRPFPAATWGS